MPRSWVAVGSTLYRGGREGIYEGCSALSSTDTWFKNSLLRCFQLSQCIGVYFDQKPSKHDQNMCIKYSTPDLWNLVEYQTWLQCILKLIPIIISFNRTRRLHWGNFADDGGRKEVTCYSRCGTIKIPPCSNAIRAEHGSHHRRASPAMVNVPLWMKYSWARL